MTYKTNLATFAQRLAGREPLVGTFLKTPSPHVCEVLGMTELAACCIDAEHAPFGRYETDQCISQLRHADMPSLVRVADDSSAEIRNALDAGATGILVPHVVDAEQAAEIVKLAHFGDQGSGYAGSTRAAGFTTKAMPDHLADSSSQTTIVLQIEDLEALENLETIAAVAGVHCLFVGRVDLAVAMGTTVNDARVVDAVKEVCRVGQAAGRAVGMFTPNLAEIGEWRSLGASFFLLNYDQGFLLQGANALVSPFNETYPETSELR